MKEYEEECPKCKGTGMAWYEGTYEQIECLSCGGNGIVYDQKFCEAIDKLIRQSDASSSAPVS